MLFVVRQFFHPFFYLLQISEIYFIFWRESSRLYILSYLSLTLDKFVTFITSNKTIQHYILLFYCVNRQSNNNSSSISCKWVWHNNASQLFSIRFNSSTLNLDVPLFFLSSAIVIVKSTTRTNAIFLSQLNRMDGKYFF